MKPLLLSLFLLISIAAQNTQKVDPENSTISFTFEDKNVVGTIGDIQSQSIIDINQLEKSTLKGSVSVTSLKTGNFLRDGHLMWEKYFNREKYPRIYFESSAIEKQNTNSYLIYGTLTIKGIAKEVIFKGKKNEKGITLISSIYTSDWNINISNLRVENELTVQMKFRFGG
jgi:polyisoprenoid-binding protein YceI